MTIIDDVIGALDDATRRAVLDELAHRGSATATQLSQRVPVTRQAVVQHLSVLARAGLVEGDRRGREHWYEVRTEGIVATARWLDQLAADWDRRLLSIKRIAEATSEPGSP